MGTGILYAVIVLAWAAYLVPIVRAHRQETAASRSVDSFANAMRVLGKRSSSARSRGGSQLSAPPPRTRPRLVVAPPTGPADDEPPVLPWAVARRSPAARRRRVLASIAGLAVVLAVLGYVSLVSWWALAVPAVLAAWFVVTARLTAPARRPHRQHIDIAPAGRVQRRRPANRPARRVDSAYASRRVATEAPASLDSDVTMIEVGRSVPGAGAGAPAPDPTSTTPDLDPASVWLRHAQLDQWDPVPVTLPTYVTKEQAKPRSVRTIDLSGPAAFTAGRLPEAEMLVRQPDTVDELAAAAHDESADDDDAGNRMVAGA